MSENKNDVRMKTHGFEMSIGTRVDKSKADSTKPPRMLAPMPYYKGLDSLRKHPLSRGARIFAAAFHRWKKRWI